MKPRNNKTGIVPLLLVILLMDCNSDTAQDEPVSFKFSTINVERSGPLYLRESAIRDVDDSDTRHTVVYKGKIISLDRDGWFACLDSVSLQPDTLLERQMNTDAFTKLSVYQDSLIAEKPARLCFWDGNKWADYSSPHPIKYFDLLFEDQRYAFYSSCMGEFGSLLFVYDKERKLTRADFTTCPNTVISTDSGYFVGTHLYHGAAHSYAYTIRDIEKLPIVPDSLRYYDGLPDRDPKIIAIVDTSEATQINRSYLRYHYPKDVLIIGTFKTHGKLFHLVDPKEFNNEMPKQLIGKVENDTLRIIDSLRIYGTSTVLQFGNTTIINELRGNGFKMARNDTIFEVRFTNSK